MILPIEGQPRPNNIRQEFSVTNPENYIIQVEEIGVAQTNPIIANFSVNPMGGKHGSLGKSGIHH